MRRCVSLLAAGALVLGLSACQGGEDPQAVLERAGRLEELLAALADERLRYYQSRRGWPTYGRGWTARTRRCLEEARRLLRGGAA